VVFQPLCHTGLALRSFSLKDQVLRAVNFFLFSVCSSTEGGLNSQAVGTPLRRCDDSFVAVSDFFYNSTEGDPPLAERVQTSVCLTFSIHLVLGEPASGVCIYPFGF